MIIGMRASLPGEYVPPAVNIVYWGADDLLWGAANQLQWG